MYIYKITDSKTNKIYVGLCSRPKDKTKWYYGGGNIITSIKKKRPSDLTKTILEEGFDSIEALRAAEQKWIKHLNAQDPTVGYNLSNGGDVCKSTWEGHEKLSEEHKAKIGKAFKGRSWWTNIETGEGRMFHDNPGEGWKKGRPTKHISKAPKNPESVAKMRATLTGRKLSEEHKAAIKAGARNQYTKR